MNLNVFDQSVLLLIMFFFTQVTLHKVYLNFSRNNILVGHLIFLKYVIYVLGPLLNSLMIVFYMEKIAHSQTNKIGLQAGHEIRGVSVN